MLDALLIIAGPTGAGKTDTALHFLNKVKGEIISADSRQIYKGMDIGTDKAPAGVREKIPHHLVDVADPGEVFTAFDFKREAEKIIRELQHEDKLPVVVGGTGLYIKALTEGIFPGPGANQKIRRKLQSRIRKEGTHSLHQELQEVDPASASRIHPNDKRRLVRALEVYYLTGEPISSHQRKSSPYTGRMVKVGLTWRRPVLYRIIEKRVDKMLQKGLIDEVQTLLEKGYRPDFTSMQAIGYQQIIAYLEGRLSLEEAIRQIKRDTRRFAKRQLTWFKKERDVIWLKREQYPSSQEAAEKIVEILLERIPDTQKVVL